MLFDKDICQIICREISDYELYMGNNRHESSSSGTIFSGFGGEMKKLEDEAESSGGHHDDKSSWQEAGALWE